MKFVLLVLSLVFVQSLSARRDTVVTYYNWQGGEIGKKEYYLYYRKSFASADGKVGVRDYYRTGVLKMEGSFESDDFSVRSGHFNYFDEAGKKTESGNYVNDRKTGIWMHWYSDGSRKSETGFLDGKEEGIAKGWHLSGNQSYEGDYKGGKKSGKWRFWHDADQLSGEGMYVNGQQDGKWTHWYENGQLMSEETFNSGQNTGEFRSWYKNGNPDSEGRYLDGKRDGEWVFYYESGKVSARETWEQGTALKVTFWNEQGEEVPVSEPLEIDPEFEGGEEAMARFISDHIYYPQLARELGIQGTVYIHFIVNRDGSLSDIRVVLSVHPVLDNEAIRVIGMMPAWKPGIHHNRLSRVSFVLPISFRIR